MSNNDVIAAIATPTGQGGIGVVRISGNGCIELVAKRFSNQKIKQSKGYTLHFGKFVNDKDEIIDECIISIFKAPRSYTKEDVVEISCHGSPYILSEILKSLLNTGARQATGGEFTLRAFLNGQLNLSQAEAVADLISSENYYSHKLALDQLRGGYSNELILLRKKLVDFASLIELELDFGEEDVEFASRSDVLETIDSLQAKLSSLIASFDLGNSLKSGIPVVIAGNPNAGKSTLLNSLLNSDRAIVSEIPGTTRDTVDDYLILEGIKFIITDTAGIRTATDSIEKKGIAKTLAHIDKAQIILYVVDVTDSNPEDVWIKIEELFKSNQELILILNKMDLYPNLNISSFIKTGLVLKEDIVPISASNKMNMSVIKEKLITKVLAGKTNDNSIVTNVRHYESLSNASAAIEKVKAGIHGNLSGDLLAIDIKQTLHHIGLITGEIHTDDLLESIFSNFCIGK